MTGGLVLVTSLVLTLRAHRTRFGAAVDERFPVPAARTFTVRVPGREGPPRTA